MKIALRSLYSCAVLTVILGSIFLFTSQVFAQTTFTISDVQSVSESLNRDTEISVRTVTITLKNGNVITFNSRFPLQAVPKEVLKQYGYIGNVHELAALTLPGSSTYTITDVKTSKLSKRQPEVTVTTNSFSYEPVVTIISSTGKQQVSLKCKKVDTGYVCGQLTRYDKRGDLADGDYYVYTTNRTGGLAAEASITVTKNGVSKNAKLTRYDVASTDDLRFYEQTKISAVSFNGATPKQFKVTLPNEDTAIVNLFDSRNIVVGGAYAIKSENGKLGTFTVPLQKALVNNEQYKLYARGQFDGRWHKVVAVRPVIFKDGTLSFSNQSPTAVVPGVIPVAPVVPVVAPIAPTVTPTPVVIPTAPSVVPPTAPPVLPVSPVVPVAPVVTPPTPVVSTPTPVVVPPTPVVTPSKSETNGWTRCATHGGTCVTRTGSDEAGVPVRYGISGNYVTKTLKGNVMCHNAIFSVRKAVPGATCEIQNSAKSAVQGASTDINFQIYTTLGAVLNYLQTNR
ncbi:MAG: hypothetical protein RLZZ70_137 [Candidatus Parcubacteria bacterium]|jgi:hypothetical protein